MRNTPPKVWDVVKWEAIILLICLLGGGLFAQNKQPSFVDSVNKYQQMGDSFLEEGKINTINLRVFIFIPIMLIFHTKSLP